MSLRALARRAVPDLRGLPRPFWVLFGGTFVNRVGGFVLIFLTFYLTDIRRFSAAQAGAIVSAYGMGAMAGSAIGGALSDRLGRRAVLVGSLLGGGAAMIGLGLVTSLAAIAAAATITGFLYEMYRPVVSAAIADIVPEPDRPRAYGLIYWVVNIGASVAPIVGGQLVSVSYRALFLADALTTAAYGVVLWAALPETRPAALPHSPAAASRVATVLRDGRFVSASLLTLALMLVFFQSFAGLPLDIRAHGLSPETFGGLMAVNGILIVLLQPFLTEVAAVRRQSRVLALASLLVGLGFGLGALVTSVPGYIISVAIWTLGEILFSPASMTLVSHLAPEDKRGLYQGVFAIMFSLAFALAPLVGGAIIATLGATWLWIGCLVAGVAVAAGFAALAD